jgi:hypothetical protein
MDGSEPGGRRNIDLFRLPKWAQLLVSLATVAVIGGLALLFGNRDSSPTVPVSAIVAGVIAFAYVAWRAQRRR